MRFCLAHSTHAAHMCVFAARRLIICACVCVPIRPLHSSTKAGEDGEQTLVASISYSVFVLHHSCTLVYTIPLPDAVPVTALPKIRLHFAAIRESPPYPRNAIAKAAIAKCYG